MAPHHTRRVVLKRGAWAVAGAAAATGCAGIGYPADRTPAADADDAASLAVSAKNFVENEILGYVALESLRAHTDATVAEEIPTGGAPANWRRLRTGDLDVYWEYTGTQYLTLPPDHSDAPRDPDDLYDAVAADAAEQGITAFPRAEFDNSFALLAPRDWQRETGVETLSELAAHVNSGNTDLSLAIGEDFEGREDGWQGLTDHYGFDADALAALRENLAVVPIGLTYELYQRGDATIVMGFSTDPQIPELDLAVLADDRSFFPPYNPAPMANTASVERTPGMADALDPLGPAIGGCEEMRSLNARVVLGDATPREVAADFLRTEGLI
jgi:osmoprotectant transport system substrate-binding protein